MGKLERARQITDVEVATLDPWVKALLAGQEKLADQILVVGLDAEHFMAQLPPDDLEITVAERQQLGSLLRRLEELTGIHLDAPPAIRTSEEPGKEED